MQTLKFPLVPPVIIRRGNKELQYVPQVLDPSISGAFLLSELLKNDNQVLELDSEKLEAASQLVGEGQFVAILWSPAKSYSTDRARRNKDRANAMYSFCNRSPLPTSLHRVARRTA